MTLMDSAKSAFLVSLGSAVYAYEMSMNMMDTFMEKGSMVLNQGKQMAKELKMDMPETKENTKPITKDELLSMLNTCNFATRTEILSMDYATKGEISEIKDMLTKLESTISSKMK